MAQHHSSSTNPKKRKDNPSANTGGKASGAASSELSAKSQKRALKQERQSQRKHAESVTEAKRIWNKLRLKTNTKEEVRQMTVELCTLIQGKVHEIALQHDASRVVQAALQFGTNEERVAILQELCSDNTNLFELSKNQYAHFVVLKSIKYGVHSPECIKIIVKAFKGHIPKLAVHATGSKIVEALLDTFPPKSTAVLKQEFYGPQLALFASDVLAPTSNNKDGPTTTPDLAFHLQQAPEKKRAAALSFLKSLIEKGMAKSLFGYTFFQQIFAEYVQNCSPSQVAEIAPTVVDHAVHLLSSKAGTKVVAACASYSTPKERRKIMKTLKGFSRSALLHRDAYLAVLRLVQVTDDTVSTHKNIFNELLTPPEDANDNKQDAKEEGDEGEEGDNDNAKTASPLLEIALNDQACKLFLMLLAPTDDEVAWKKIFDPYELEIMHANPTLPEGGVEVPTSKKEPETRREELMQYLQKPLLELCENHAKELLLSLAGSALIKEVYHRFHPKELVEAVVQVCESDLDNSGSSGKDDSGEEEEEAALSLFEDRVGHLAIKNLILCDVDDDGDDTSSSEKLLAKEFFNKLQDRLLDIAQSNRGAFVVAALCKVPGVREDAIKKLQKKAALLKKKASEGNATAGYKALLKEIEGK